MKFAQPLDADYISKVGFAMGSIVFTDDQLDKCLSSIAPQLMSAFGDSPLYEADEARLAMAKSLALVAALQSIRDASDLEHLLLAVGFLCEDDTEALKTLKSVTLDQTLIEAVSHEGRAVSPHAAEDVARMQYIHRQARDLLQARGYGVAYFDACPVGCNA